MNRIVSAWLKHENKSEYDGPDILTIDGEKIQVEEIDKMALRKSPHTTAVMDNDVVNKNPKAEESLEINELSKNDFNKIIAYIRNCNILRVHELLVITRPVLKRLGKKRNTSKAVTKTPQNVSTQVDIGTFKTWTGKIQLNNSKSITQLIVIDATAKVRTQ